MKSALPRASGGRFAPPMVAQMRGLVVASRASAQNTRARAASRANGPAQNTRAARAESDEQLAIAIEQFTKQKTVEG